MLCHWWLISHTDVCFTIIILKFKYKIPWAIETFCLYSFSLKCRQARRTRSEVSLLWKNNLPIMVEVMLLPDCCYSDDGPTTEGIDLNDPAIKQDALLLERWILEPVPRQWVVVLSLKVVGKSGFPLLSINYFSNMSCLWILFI